MFSEIAIMLATFTAPEDIGVNPASMLWIFPVLASIAIIYKATKMRVIFWKKFLKESGILFLTLSIVMTAAAIGIHVLVMILTT